MQREAAGPDRFFTALEAAGMPPVPDEFSVVPQHQVVPAGTLRDIARFIQVFDQVTARPAWQAAVRRAAPPVAWQPRPETCFFSAWDFHLPPDGGCQLIEFNDNGSGFLFAAIINAVYYETAGARVQEMLVQPLALAGFERRLCDLVNAEAAAFFQSSPNGLLLVLDDADSLRDGKFRRELRLLRDVFRAAGWRAEVGPPTETAWNGHQLLFAGQPVAFVVNRSTDFFWQSDAFSALRQAYESGQVYIAPNPFTYATRSDKRLLELLSLPDWDAALGIQPEERAILAAHTPETHVVRGENLDRLAQEKQDFVFKPLHGFASRGLLDNAMVGRERLRRLVKHGEGYVAQRWVSKPAMQVQGVPLWCDLRVWAYRGEIFNLSGRASRRPDRLDLTPPGGWLPTYPAL